MKHEETWLCTEKHGPRPAGEPDKCFYCGVRVGEFHKEDCVLRLKTVIVRATIEYPVVVPESWTAHNVEFHRNEGSWCCNNMIDELENLFADKNPRSPCACNYAEFSFVRDATESDEDCLPAILNEIKER